MTSRNETFKTLEKYYKNRAKGKQKERVNDLLKLYKEGKIFSKISIQREVNRYLGKSFKTEDERELHYFKTMTNYLSNVSTKTLENKKTKIDTGLDKLEDIRAGRLIKDEYSNTSYKKAFSSIHIELNTKSAFKNMPNEEFKVITKEEYDKWRRKERDEPLDWDAVYVRDENDPHQDTEYIELQSRLERIIKNKLKDIDKTVKVALAISFTAYKVDYSTTKSKYVKGKYVGEEKVFDTNKYTYEQQTRLARTKVKQLIKASFEDDLEHLLGELELKTIEQLLNLEGSNWLIKKYNKLIIEVYRTKPARGSSYIPTPAPYNNSRCGLVNIQNNDLECFKWCMKYHQTKKGKHDDRISVLSKLEDKYNYEGVNFPASYDDIKKFEDNNKTCIFIYYIDENNNIIKERNGNNNYYSNDLIYLLRIENEEKSHFVYIKHISRLLNLSTQKDDCNKRFCPFCQSKVQIEKFDKHISTCYKIAQEGTILKMPEEGSVMKFKNYKNMLERPFMVVFDSESTLVKTNDKNKIHKHIVNSCCYHFTCSFNSERNYLKTFVGDNCIIDMIKDLMKLEEKCYEEMRDNQGMKLTKEDHKNFNNATTCCLCGGEFDESKKALSKVRDHDHRTGKYRGATHSKCNINYFCNRYLPIVAHNLRGYDGHLIIKEAYKLGENRISAIPNSNEKFMCFSIGHLKFIDSFQFLSSSLEKLTDNLYDSDDKYKHFHNTKKEFSDNLDLLCRKGYYPYEWFDNTDKFNYKGLPSKEDFYSSLSQTSITEDEYKHALNVYDKMNCEKFLDYHLLYLKCDVLLLSDIFSNFRKTTKEYYNLDPLNYISAASLAWDAMLLKTKVELDLISDITILDIIERSKRGGLCFVGSKRRVKANNRLIGNYDESKPEDYILYLDANNLYGWAMVQKLPYKDLKYSNETTLKEVLETSDDNETGYILEVDLEYPENLHDLFKEYPPCPENIKPDIEWFSEFQKELYKKVQNNKDKNNKYKGCNKLIPHLFKHEKYCLHYRNLKFINNLGINITKVHNIISFKQKEWLKPYIDFNTEKRKGAKNEFEKDFFKLMNNSVFGKTMENVRNRMKLHLTIDDDNAKKWFTKPTLKCNKFIDGLHLIEMYNEEMEMDKPIYVGTSILDLSKLCMMDFHYNVIEKVFHGKYNLIYSDTDSLVYRIEHPNIYEWIKDNKTHFDLSESANDDLRDNTNKKVLGKFKDEMNSLLIKEFVGLIPKVYSIIHQEYNQDTKYNYWKNKKTLKGVSKAVVKNDIEHNDYVDVISTNNVIKKDVVSIRSFDHQLYTYKQPKIALTSFYDKMCMVSENDCLPFGYRL